MNILDIDLDFFLDRAPIFVSTDNNKRLKSGSYTPWSTIEVEDFLSKQCGLNKKKKIPGKLLTHHDELFYEIRNLFESGTIKMIYNLDHVDAHADLGLGDLCFNYLFFNLLRKPIPERYYHDNDIPNIKKMGPGNYLLFMIACDWIRHLRYIHLDNQAEDLNYVFFKDLKIDSGKIKLRVYCDHQMPEEFEKIDPYRFISETNPCRTGKDVTLKTTQYKDFVTNLSYDYIFLSKSPTHTPVESDELIPTIMQYIEEL